MSLNGPWRRKSPKVSSVKEWWWMVLSPPKSMPGVEGARFALRRWRRADGSGGSEGEGNGSIKPIPGIEWSHSLRGQQGGGGRVRCLVRKVPYQAKRVQRTKE